jgi:hypothetical protein
MDCHVGGECSYGMVWRGELELQTIQSTGSSKERRNVSIIPRDVVFSEIHSFGPMRGQICSPIRQPGLAQKC